MKLNWDAIGAIGEVVGAISVVVTLFYLSIQIRQNTRSNTVAAEIVALQQLAGWVSRISKDKDAQRLWDLVAEGSSRRWPDLWTAPSPANGGGTVKYLTHRSSANMSTG